jgi:hypothetical protein
VSEEPKFDRYRTNAEIRRWYLELIGAIPEQNNEWIKQGLSAQGRAEAAWNIRHEARLEARSLMADPEEAELLRERDRVKYGNPNGPTFEFLVQRLEKAGLEGDAIYEAIIDNSYRTDAELNQKLGL